VFGGCRSAWTQAPASKRWRKRARRGRPAIFNTDQGSQFTSLVFTDVLEKAKIAIRMDGRGAWRDNVFVERLWRTIKYEQIYLRAYATPCRRRARRSPDISRSTMLDAPHEP
jgi:transposase InsO family protein